MNAVRTVQKLLRRRRMQAQSTFVRAHDELYGLTQAFCASDSSSAKIRRATLLFSYIWDAIAGAAFVVRLLRWIRIMEQDRELAASFAVAWDELLVNMDSVSLLAEADCLGIMRWGRSCCVGSFKGYCRRRGKSSTRAGCWRRSSHRARRWNGSPSRRVLSGFV